MNPRLKNVQLANLSVPIHATKGGYCKEQFSASVTISGIFETRTVNDSIFSSNFGVLIGILS